MNDCSAAPGEGRPTLNINRWLLSDWFQKNHGKEKSSVEKLLLTDEHKRQQVIWARKHWDLFTNTSAPVVFLDEKWFYTTSRRRKRKILPKGSHEEEEPNYVAPRMHSRRHPVKVMYLGVVANLQPDYDFDGRVMMKRVSKWKKAQRAQPSKRLSVDVHINDALRRGH